MNPSLTRGQVKPGRLSRGRAVALGLLGVLAALLLWLGSGSGVAGPSVQNKDPDGLRAAFAYLEARGTEVRAWRRPLHELPLEPGVLMLQLPWTRPLDAKDQDTLRRWRLTGGTIVLSLPEGAKGPFDDQTLQALDLTVTKNDLAAPETLADLERVVRAEPSGELRPGRPLRMAMPWWQLQPFPQHEVLVRGSSNQALLLQTTDRGKLLALASSSALSNRFLGEPGNLDLLEQIAAEGRAVYFDEWHLGHADPAPSEPAAATLPLRLLGLHLCLLYALVVWSLARRMGPDRAVLPLPRSSVGRDLDILARLHLRGRHARAATDRLLHGAHQAKRRPIDLPHQAERGDERELIDVARAIGELQRRHIL